MGTIQVALLPNLLALEWARRTDYRRDVIAHVSTVSSATTPNHGFTGKKVTLIDRQIFRQHLLLWWKKGPPSRGFAARRQGVRSLGQAYQIQTEGITTIVTVTDDITGHNYCQAVGVSYTTADEQNEKGAVNVTSCLAVGSTLLHRRLNGFPFADVTVIVTPIRSTEITHPYRLPELSAKMTVPRMRMARLTPNFQAARDHVQGSSWSLSVRSAPDSPKPAAIPTP
jgi:hypothetical protein